MRQDVRSDFEKENRVAKRLIAPMVIRMIGGEFYITETTSESVEFLLDRHAGFDALHKTEDGLLRGVAMRIQFCDKAFNTFTVRTKRSTGAQTEFAKRVLAIEKHDTKGALYPWLTMQAYVSKNEKKLLSMAIIKTITLFTFLQSNQANRKINPADKNEFVFAPWNDLGDIVVYPR